MIKEKILVLCVDRDNDLRKVKKTGPIIGKEENKKAATALLMNDPEEPDGNAMLQAIKVYDEVSKTKDSEIVTLTGDDRLGYVADKQITNQLEKVLNKFPADSCIFISDGAEDEEIMPLISSRIKIDSKKTLVMKQAKELEKTYVVLLNKLKEPYYARLIFGIPAILLLAFVLSESLGFGTRPILGILGIYLLIKGFGLEEILLSFGKNLFILPAGAPSIVYIPIAALIVISLSLGVSQYNEKLGGGFTIFESISFSIKSILVFIPFIIFLIFISNLLVLFPERKKFEVINIGMSSITAVLVAFLGYMATAWVVGEAWFYELLAVTFLSIIIALFGMEIEKKMKLMVANSLKLENKEVINQKGFLVGKVVGVDKKKNEFIVLTSLGNKIHITLESIIEAGEKIVVRK